MKTRAIRRMGDLQTGVAVITPDGLQWTIVSHSSYTGQMHRAAKWCWLQRGNQYRHINGLDFETLRIVQDAAVAQEQGEDAEGRPDVLSIDPATVQSAVLRRLIAEVQQEQGEVTRAYDRVHNRHNRGPYPRPPVPVPPPDDPPPRAQERIA